MTLRRRMYFAESSDVDPSLWRVQRKFGVAGGPDEIVLTDEGRICSFRIGAKVGQKEAEALLALNAQGGSGYLEEPAGGARWKMTDLLLHWDMLVWGKLKKIGYVERIAPEPGVHGEMVKLTSKGMAAVEDGFAEQERLLSRIIRQEKP